MAEQHFQPVTLLLQAISSKNKEISAHPGSLGPQGTGILHRAASLSEASFPYSIRNASIGEIEAARADGIIPATNADIARALAAVISAMGSQLEMP